MAKGKLKMKTEVLVIGSGPAGSSVANRCAKAGKKVVVVDRLFGGTCALRGCTPKKVMESITSKYWEAKAMEKAGFPILNQPVDFHQLAAHRSKFTALVPGQTKRNFKEKNIEVVTGIATFQDEHTVQVGDTNIQAATIVLATGARPRSLNIPGEEYLITNDAFFSLDQIPEKIAIVGGGYIAFELSHILAACGAKVTIFSNAETPLAIFETELVTDLIQATLAKGVEVKLGYQVEAIEKSQTGYSLTCLKNDDQHFSFSADSVLHAAGRIPNIDQLNISTIGLSLNERDGIEVNKFLQTKTYPHIFALGDATGYFPFTEIASYEATVVAHNILEKRRKSVRYEGIPYGVFTYPKLAKVGPSEAKLKANKQSYEVKTERLSNAFLERAHLNTFARYKTFIDPKTDKILGANILATHADEIINLISFAIQNGMTNSDFRSLLLLYPTAGHQAKFFFGAT